VYAAGGAHNADGNADAVLWRFDGQEWIRIVLPDTHAFLWDLLCDAEGACYAAGTAKTFVALEP
jgi:hypothetical protein